MSVAKPSIAKRTLDKFIAELDAGRSVTDACRASHIGRTTAYAYRITDDDFAARWDAAIEAGTDKLEQEAMRRALDGSDSLLQFLLRGRRRAVYGEKVDVTAKVEAVTSAELAALRRAADENPDAWEAVARAAARALPSEAAA